MKLTVPSNLKRVGFVSTRIAGTDGVSLEARKWAEVMERMGLECYYVAGECDAEPGRMVLIDEAHFNHPVVEDIQKRAFTQRPRDKQLTADIQAATIRIKKQLHDAIERLRLDVLIAENALTIPMNLPLGLALVHVVQERNMPCVAHHHDFYWERERFLRNCVDDMIQAAFPPPLKHIQHVVINTQAAEEFSRRTGISCRVIPNVMDFAAPPAPLDEYALQFRRTVGLRNSDLLILQPTRVVARKGIEHAIQLVRMLDDPRAKLVITHSSGDEGDGYAQHVRRFAQLMGVNVLFVDRWIAEQRATDAEGRPLFTIGDVYPQADLVTYPSTYEGFGNAFLEAVYYKCPIVCNRYAVFRTDIEPCGFRTIQIDGYVSDETIKQVRRVLSDRSIRQELVEHNYAVARTFFSYDVVEHELRSIFRRPEVACRCGVPCVAAETDGDTTGCCNTKPEKASQDRKNLDH